MMQRRTVLRGIGAAIAAAGGGVPALAAGGLDPRNPRIRFGTTGSYFGRWDVAADGRQTLRMSEDVATILRDIAHYGLEGFEPYAPQVAAYADRPMALRALLRQTGVALASVGGTPVARSAPALPVPPTGDPGPWLGGTGRAEMIAQMEACARDFLQPLGVVAWKQNMGTRPPGGPTDDQLDALADTANEIGRRCKPHGVKLALHPHIWGPMEREHEFRRVMARTDPAYVYLCLDTGHNTLGGMDTVPIATEFFPRIAHVHLKDTFARYRRNQATPDQTAHYKDRRGFYAGLGQGGGVDFPGLFALLRARRYAGWVVFDIDAPRAGDGTGTVDDNLAGSINYLRDTLGIRLPPASGSSGLFRAG